MCGGNRGTWIPYLLWWLSLIVGAAAGALSYAQFGLASLRLAAAWAGALAMAAGGSISGLKPNKCSA